MKTLWVGDSSCQNVFSVVRVYQGILLRIITFVADHVMSNVTNQVGLVTAVLLKLVETTQNMKTNSAGSNTSHLFYGDEMVLIEIKDKWDLFVAILFIIASDLSLMVFIFEGTWFHLLKTIIAGIIGWLFIYSSQVEMKDKPILIALPFMLVYAVIAVVDLII